MQIPFCRPRRMPSSLSASWSGLSGRSDDPSNDEYDMSERPDGRTEGKSGEREREFQQGHELHEDVLSV